MQEVPGEPNSHTHMAVQAVQGPWGLYRLEPISGKRHQLRVHMAALGLPLRNDPFYPEVGTTRPKATTRAPCSCWPGRCALPTR